MQLGGTDETEFYGPTTTDFKHKKLTYKDQYLISQFSIKLNLNPHLQIVNRKIDGLLDWIATWGGLLYGLHLIAELLIEVYSVYFIKAKLAWLLVKVLPSSPPPPDANQGVAVQGDQKDSKQASF